MVTKRRATDGEERVGVEFSTAYTGPAVDDGRMNAKQFAPALFAMASLIERSATVVQPQSAPLVVEVNANFRRGSFEYGLAAMAVIGQQVMQTWTSAGIEAMLDYLGLLPKKKEPNLVDFVEQVGSAQIVATDATGDGHVNVSVVGDNNHITIFPSLRPEVARLAADGEVRKQLSEVVDPVRTIGIEALRIGPERRPFRLITKPEAPKFLPPPPARARLTDSTAVTAVEILSPSFVDGNKWRVAQGGEAFWLTISDERFLREIDNGETFAKGDYLIVEMRTEAYKTPGGLEVQREAVRVERHERRAPKQGGLF